MSTQSILEQLSNEDYLVRKDAVSKFRNAPKEDLEKLFQKVAEDFNHEVREAAAEEILIYPIMYRVFIGDPDPKVRISIVNKSVEIKNLLGPMEQVIDQLKVLENDPVAEVRCAFARILYQHVNKEPTQENMDFVVSKLVPIIDKLLSDRNDDVKICVSLNIKELTIIFGFDFIFEKLYSSLHHMLTDLQWRVRNNAVELLFGLALVCSSDFFDANLNHFLLEFLKDPCYKVRQFALSSLPTLAAKFGEKWLKEKLVPGLKELAESQNFLHRATYLHAVSALVSFFPVQYQSNYVFQPMIRMLKDSVSNVVLLSIELLKKHKDSIHPFRRQYELKPILESLVENSPPTVKQHANDLLSKC